MSMASPEATRQALFCIQRNLVLKKMVNFDGACGYTKWRPMSQATPLFPIWLEWAGSKIENIPINSKGSQCKRARIAWCMWLPVLNDAPALRVETLLTLRLTGWQPASNFCNSSHALLVHVLWGRGRGARGSRFSLCWHGAETFLSWLF